jgi:hypothetical protein
MSGCPCMSLYHQVIRTINPLSCRVDRDLSYHIQYIGYICNIILYRQTKSDIALHSV